MYQSSEGRKNKRPGGLPAPIQGEGLLQNPPINENSEVVNNSLIQYQPAWADQNPLSMAYVQFMDRFTPFQIYGHLTARDIPGKGMRVVKRGYSRYGLVRDYLPHHIHPESFKKAFGLFVHKLNREVFGSRYYKRPDDGVTWFSGYELQERGAIHSHLVIGRIPTELNTPEWRIGLKEKWFEHVGIGRLYEYDPAQGGGFYLAKSAYMFKRGDIEFGGPLARQERNRLL
jgi:hypothetical protein